MLLHITSSPLPRQRGRVVDGHTVEGHFYAFNATGDVVISQETLEPHLSLLLKESAVGIKAI
jgi:hypothetical protein